MSNLAIKSSNKTQNLFSGLSTLREQERKKEGAPTKKVDTGLQDYLKRYASGASDPSTTDAGTSLDSREYKRKKKQPGASSSHAAIRIVDQDESIRIKERSDRPQNHSMKRGKGGDDDDDEEEEEEFKPIIVNPEEAKALEEQAKRSKDYYASREDGSRWMPIQHSSTDKPLGQAGWEGRTGGGRTGKEEDGDISPPRRGRRQRHDSPDIEPTRRPRPSNPSEGNLRPPPSEENCDLIPLGASRVRDHDDLSPPRRGGDGGGGGGRGGGDEDASPPRRRQRHDSPLPPPPPPPPYSNDRDRVNIKDEDASPPRRRQRHDSPPSPSRRNYNDSAQVRNQEVVGGGGARPRMLDGTVAGLVSARELAEEARGMKEENERKRLNAVGRGAETIYRDRESGRAVSKETFVDNRAKERRSKKEEREEDQYLAWRGGLAQKREKEEKVRREREEADKPFARYEHDEDHEAMLKGKARFGDPFAHLQGGGGRSHGGDGGGDGRGGASSSMVDKYDARELERSGFRVPQTVPPHSWLKRGVADPGNRYNIRPGKHWDGVVRGNGFEKELFKSIATRAARDSEARQWAQADM